MGQDISLGDNLSPWDFWMGLLEGVRHSSRGFPDNLNPTLD